MMFKTAFRDDEIEFLCAEEDFGIIPAPFPAGKFIPDWFKALPMKLGTGFQSSTIKRCSPFLDSMLAGYIIPLAADVWFETNEDCSGVTYQWKFPKTMVENHSSNQITTDKTPNPLAPKHPMKFLNYWKIKTPKDYSLLFVPPLNRADPRFQCMSGIVDAPYAELEYVNFPFTLNQPNFSGIIEAGTPLVQVIPIKKDNLLTKHRKRPVTSNELQKSSWLSRIREGVHESLYRDKIHRKI